MKMTIDELKLLTRDELIQLWERLSFRLSKLAPGSHDRADVIATLADIRAVLATKY
ncbi:MAG: hypothetical protein JNL41_10075, partial [Phenylobacterium sp.]|nr:hypothetical protein [Phenylobacterium sp.]